MRFVYALALVCALVLPTVASAGAWSKGCQFTGGTLAGVIGTPTNTSLEIRPGDIGCYRYNNADGVHFSPMVKLLAEQGVVVVDAGLNDEVTVATAMRVRPRLCASGSILEPANPERSCLSVGGTGATADFDGVEGGPTVQNFTKSLPQGMWTFHVTVACAAAETCQVSLIGVGANR